MQHEYLKLCLITNQHNQTFEAYKKILMAAIAGGITSIQVREKNQNLWQLEEFVKNIKLLIKPYHIRLIINDHVDLAKKMDVDGVHLGQQDMSPNMARKILGPHKIIGLSIESLEQLQEANQFTSLNYVAASAIFPSKNKLDCNMLWGLDGLRTLCQQSYHPVIAIGGIHQDNVKDVVMNGAAGVAVISAIHDVVNPEKAARNILAKIHQGKCHVKSASQHIKCNKKTKTPYIEFYE